MPDSTDRPEQESSVQAPATDLIGWVSTSRRCESDAMSSARRSSKLLEREAAGGGKPTPSCKSSSRPARSAHSCDRSPKDDDVLLRSRRAQT